MRVAIAMVKRCFRLLWFALAAIAFSSFSVARQEAPSAARQQAPDSHLVLKAETGLVLVRFHVVRKNRYAEDIRAEDIRFFEDGVPQKIALLEGGATAPRTVPVDVILLFDNSGSVMNAGLLDPLGFKQSLLDALSYARIGVYSFSNKARCFTHPTRDAAAIERGLAGILNRGSGGRVVPYEDPKRVGTGGTLLYESVVQMIRDVSALPGDATRSLLVFSDSFSTSTKASAAEAVNAARTFGYPLYPVLLGHERLLERARAAQQRAIQNTRRPASQDRPARLDAQEEQMEEFAGMGELTGGEGIRPPAATTTTGVSPRRLSWGAISCASSE